MSIKPNWLEHIRNYQKGPKIPLAAYLRKKGLAYQTMLYWLKKTSPTLNSPGEFLPVKFNNSSGPIKVKLGEIDIELAEGFNRQLLKDIVATLKEVQC